MLLTPDGKPAGNTDRIMLLAMWANFLSSQPTTLTIIKAGIGKPTFPLSDSAAAAGSQYWSSYWLQSQNARKLIAARDGSSSPTTRVNITATDSAIGYGHPAGDAEHREKMASALDRWYDGVEITDSNVLFTVAGAGALHVIFETLQKISPNCLILTPFPHYSLYAGAHTKNNLFPINVMKTSGYQLTAEAFSKSLQKANKVGSNSQKKVGAFLLCDPNNPLGTVANENELRKIAEILKDHPEIIIILDEAYAEMQLSGKKHKSFLTIATEVDSELKKRIVVLRSATKALSAAGERMGVILAFNDELMGRFLEVNIGSVGHAPRSSQRIFTEAMDKLDERELVLLNRYYKPQVEYVFTRLTQMGAAMPDSSYKVEGTFYVCGDFSDLLGQVIPSNATVALNKTGKTETDEDIAYSLLFENGVMLAPLSYFGMTGKEGYLRITCSGGDDELKTLMERLENKLLNARIVKRKELETKLTELRNKLKNPYRDKYNEVLQNLDDAQQKIGDSPTARNLKEYNNELKDLISKTENFYLEKEAEKIPNEKKVAARKILGFFRISKAQKKLQHAKTQQDIDWKDFVSTHYKEGKTKSFLLTLSSPVERATLPEWQTYLQKKSNEPTERRSLFITGNLMNSQDSLTPGIVSPPSSCSSSISASPPRANYQPSSSDEPSIKLAPPK